MSFTNEEELNLSDENLEKFRETSIISCGMTKESEVFLKGILENELIIFDTVEFKEDLGDENEQRADA